jgi:hypothetical protein
MATVFEEQRSILSSLWAKGLNAKHIHKDIFSVYVGKGLSCKAAPPWWQIFP